MLTKILLGLLITMMFFKLLGFFARWWLQRKLARFMEKQQEAFGKNFRQDSKPLNEAKDMVRCASCNLFLPRERALEKQGHHFCGTDHQQAYFKKQ